VKKSNEQKGNMQPIRLENNINSISEVSVISQLQDVNTDLILSLCGKKLGSGSYRTVYEHNWDKRYVVKIEPNNTECNMAEFMLWSEVCGLCGDLAWVKDWFAPVLWMSPNGKILVMRRTQEKDKKERPRKVPDFFTDLKRENFGWIGNKFVCHDYGFIHKFIKYGSKMQKVRQDAWW